MRWFNGKQPEQYAVGRQRPLWSATADCLNLWQNVEDGMFKILPRVPRNPMRRYYMMHSTKTEDRSWIRILLSQFPLIESQQVSIMHYQLKSTSM